MRGRAGELRGKDKTGNKTLDFQFAPFYLEAGDLPDDGLAEFDDGVRVLAERAHVMVFNSWKPLMVQKLLPNFAQAGLELQLLTYIGVCSHQDDWGQVSYCLKGKLQGIFIKCIKKQQDLFQDVAPLIS